MDGEQKRKPDNVPYVVFDDMVANYQWIIKKMVYALIVVVLLMFISNAAWLYSWMQYDYSSTETTVESDGNSVANYTGGDGGVIYGGTSNGQENDPNQAQ